MARRADRQAPARDRAAGRRLERPRARPTAVASSRSTIDCSRHAGAGNAGGRSSRVIRAIRGRLELDDADAVPCVPRRYSARAVSATHDRRRRPRSRSKPVARRSLPGSSRRRETQLIAAGDALAGLRPARDRRRASGSSSSGPESPAAIASKNRVMVSASSCRVDPACVVGRSCGSRPHSVRSGDARQTLTLRLRPGAGKRRTSRTARGSRPRSASRTRAW